MLPFETTLLETLERQAAHHAGKTALAFLDGGEGPGISLSYAQFAARVRSLAGALRAVASPGERVLLTLAPGASYATALWACFYAGLAAVPVYPPDPAVASSLEAVRGVVEDAEVAAVVAPDVWHPMVAGLAPGTAVLAPEAQGDYAPPPMRPDAPAVLLYTSGSTGTPKAVVLTHRNLLHNARIMAAATAMTARDRFCLWVPPYHVSGLFSGLVLPIALGAEALLFSPADFAAAPVRWLRAMATANATVSGSPTFAYELCAASAPAGELDGIDLSSWRVAVVGGEAVRADALDRFAERFGPLGFRPQAFFPMFGLTECTMIATGGPLANEPARRVLSRAGLEIGVARRPDAPDEALTLMASGHALPETTVAIVDPASGGRMPDGRVGEIWIAGASVAAGYWRREELTAETFHSTLAEMPGVRFLRTGDFGFMDDGELTVTGRLKELIIVRGLNHYPEDLERTATRLDPQLAAGGVAAFALPGAGGDERLMLALELPQETGPTERAGLYGRLREGIARDHGVQVSAFVAVAPLGLPRTPTRKIQRAACRAAVERGEWTLEGDVETLMATPWPAYTADAGVDERASLTAYLAELVAIAAGRRAADADPEAPFAVWGLDSLVMVKLAVHLQRAAGRVVPVSMLFDCATPRALIAALLDGQDTDSLAGFDLARETDPDLDAVSVGALPAAPAVPRRWLLTGATGFLGRRLVRELLSDPGASVVCLARGQSTADARQRVVSGLPEGLAARVEVLHGDLRAPRYGLAESDWQRLAADVDAVVLNGASVNFVAGYRQLREVNVAATRTGIALAATAVRKPVHFVSTVGVFNAAGRERFPVLAEGLRPADWRDVFGGYAQSKWVAETMLERAGAALTISVYRAGLIGGDAATGETNLDDFVSRLFRGCVELGAFPDVDIKLEWVPVDFVAAAITTIARRPAPGATYHLVNPAPLPLRGAFAALASRGHDLQPLPLEQWLAELSSAPASNALYPLLPFLAERGTRANLTFLELFTQGPCPGFGTERADGALAGTAVRCPPLDGALLDTYFDHFERVGWLPAAPTLA